MRKRPYDFFGPEDYDGTEPWEVTDAAIKEQQRLWDEEYAKLPKLTFWQKIKSMFKGPY